MTSADDRDTGHVIHEDPVASPRFLALPMPVLDIVIGGLLTAFAAWLWIGAGAIERSGRGLTGPAGFPRGVALILGAVSLVMAARGAFELRTGRGVETVKVAQPVAVFVAMVLVIVYPLLLGYFGYYIVTGPWLVALLLVTGNRNPVTILLCAGGFLLFTRLVFEKLMGIALP